MMIPIEMSDENNVFKINLPKIPEKGDDIFYWYDGEDSDPEYKMITSVSYMMDRRGKFDCIRIDVELC